MLHLFAVNCFKLYLFLLIINLKNYLIILQFI